MLEQVAAAQEDPRVQDYRRLKLMGLPRPKDAPLELWEAAGPYTLQNAIQATQAQLDQLIVDRAQGDMPKDEKQVMKQFFPQAVKVRAECMHDVEAKWSDRLQASQTFIEHTIGKPEQKVEHAGSLAIEVHNQMEKLVRDLRSGTIVDTENLLAKPRTSVDTFIEQHMSKGFIVGKKVTPDVQSVGQSQAREGLSEGASGKA